MVDAAGGVESHVTTGRESTLLQCACLDSLLRELGSSQVVVPLGGTQPLYGAEDTLAAINLHCTGESLRCGVVYNHFKLGGSESMSASVLKSAMQKYVRRQMPAKSVGAVLSLLILGLRTQDKGTVTNLLHRVTMIRLEDCFGQDWVENGGGGRDAELLVQWSENRRFPVGRLLMIVHSMSSRGTSRVPSWYARAHPEEVADVLSGKVRAEAGCRTSQTALRFLAHRFGRPGSMGLDKVLKKGGIAAGECRILAAVVAVMRKHYDVVKHSQFMQPFHSGRITAEDTACMPLEVESFVRDRHVGPGSQARGVGFREAFYATNFLYPRIEIIAEWRSVYEKAKAEEEASGQPLPALHPGKRRKRSPEQSGSSPGKDMHTASSSPPPKMQRTMSEFLPGSRAVQGKAVSPQALGADPPLALPVRGYRDSLGWVAAQTPVRSGKMAYWRVHPDSEVDLVKGPMCKEEALRVQALLRCMHDTHVQAEVMELEGPVPVGRPEWGLSSAVEKAWWLCMPAVAESVPPLGVGLPTTVVQCKIMPDVGMEIVDMKAAEGLGLRACSVQDRLVSGGGEEGLPWGQIVRVLLDRFVHGVGDSARRNVRVGRGGRVLGIDVDSRCGWTRERLCQAGLVEVLCSGTRWSQNKQSIANVIREDWKALAEMVRSRCLADGAMTQDHRSSFALEKLEEEGLGLVEQGQSAGSRDLAL